MNKGNRSLRLSAIAAGVFGFAASLSAFAGWGCDHCLPIYYECTSANPDNTQGCLEQFWDCERAGGCQISFPPG